MCFVTDDSLADSVVSLCVNTLTEHILDERCGTQHFCNVLVLTLFALI